MSRWPESGRPLGMRLVYARAVRGVQVLLQVPACMEMVMAPDADSASVLPPLLVLRCLYGAVLKLSTTAVCVQGHATGAGVA
eukprot:912173-Rhodomonas_salina.4